MKRSTIIKDVMEEFDRNFVGPKDYRDAIKGFITSSINKALDAQAEAIREVIVKKKGNPGNRRWKGWNNASKAVIEALNNFYQ